MEQVACRFFYENLKKFIKNACSLSFVMYYAVTIVSVSLPRYAAMGRFYLLR